MAVDPENVSRVLSVLSHRIRREILLILNEKGERSFTDLLNALNVDTGKLSFHIKNLFPFIEQTSTGKYKLSRAGESAVRVIKDVAFWAEVAGIDPKASHLPLASFGKRAFAFLIDFAIMLVIILLLLFTVVLSSITANLFVLSLNLLFIDLGLLWVYSTLLEGFSGQSIGKRTLGLKVVRADGGKLSYEHAAVRNFGKVLLPFDLLFGYLLNDPRYLRYFDKFAGTTVIDMHIHKPADSVEQTPKQSTP